jgi:hypothetical protein
MPAHFADSIPDHKLKTKAAAFAARGFIALSRSPIAQSNELLEETSPKADLKSPTALFGSPEIFSSSSKNSWTASGGTLKLMLSNFHSAG